MSILFKQNEYRPRIIDATIDEYLKSCGAICIEGPKWCGKTWTSAFHSESEFLVGDPDNHFSNRALAEMRPSLVLQGTSPRMIDEWQEVPALWDAVRAEVDKRNSYGNFILTGSSTPKTKGILHSGMGRIVSLKMQTMSLYESGDSSGKVSLKDLVDNRLNETFFGEVDLEALAYYIVRGGWPKNLKASNPRIAPQSYIDSIINSNLTGDEDGRVYSKDKIERILKSLARNECTTVSYNTIAKDITDYDGHSISADTINIYMKSMDRMFLFNNQLPYDSHVRSSLRVKMASKRHFCDPALACSLLDLNTDKLLNDLETFGFLFESLVERDLSIYAQAIGAKCYHYQNYSNEEIDAVLELSDGDWCAFEIKLGANKIDQAAENLLKVSRHIIENNGKAPKIKCVICGLTNAAYQRSDGVYVVPITALKD